MASGHRPHVIVIVVDRLGAAWLGPYGNAWSHTPHLNRLAAEGLLAEFMIADHTRLDALYRGYWDGLPSFSHRSAPPCPSLPALARQAGWHTLVVTDDAALAYSPVAAQFGEQLLVQRSAPTRPAKSADVTRVADVFQTAAEQLAPDAPPTLLWVHASAMETTWDAPDEYAERFLAEDDPPPPKLWLPPSRELAAGFDPDELLGYVHAYAAQVAVVDECLGVFLAAVAERWTNERTAVLFTSPRGYPLGEHGQIGAGGDALRGEVLQVPLIMRLPSASERMTRLTGLHQNIDVYATLAALLGSPGGQGIDLAQAAGEGSAAWPYVTAWTDQERAIRTPAWFYRERLEEGHPAPELFVKPDDRWEVNEVSARAAHVQAEFEQLIQALAAQRESARLPDLPLPEVLRHPAE